MAPPDELLAYLSDDERAEVARLLAATRKPWTPLPGPQTQGYVSEATIVGFGGAAGGGVFGGAPSFGAGSGGFGGGSGGGGVGGGGGGPTFGAAPSFGGSGGFSLSGAVTRAGQ